MLAAVVSGCAPAADSTQSREELKKGLIALDNGDEAGAQASFEASLQADPSNSKARTALASIEAKRAGVALKEWLDPLLSAGKQMDSKLRFYRDSSAAVADISATMQQAKQDQQPAAGEVDSEGREKLKKRILGVHKAVGKAAVGAIILIDTFHGVPYLKPEQIAGLDRAIQILKDENPEPARRSEEVKVYLSVLSMVRLIHFTRSFLGNFDQEAVQLFTAKSRFCNADSSEARESVMHIRDSIFLLEESLRFETPPTDGPRKARYKLHGFVKKYLAGDDWNDVELFFQRGSEQNQTAMRYFDRFCGPRGSVNDDGTPARKGGANLFDPDEE